MKDPKIIGKGSYGCVFKPPIPCKYLHNFDLKHKNDIMKFVDTSLENNIKEEEISYVVRKIDPQSDYFIPLSNDKCVVKEIKVLSKCEKYVEAVNNVPYRGIFVKYGGLTLDDYLDNHPISLDTTFNFLLHLADGIQILHDNNIVHLDIKPNNVVIDQDLNIRIIDFGLSEFAKEFTSDDLVLFYELYPLFYSCITAPNTKILYKTYKHLDKDYKIIIPKLFKLSRNRNKYVNSAIKSDDFYLSGKSFGIIIL